VAQQYLPDQLTDRRWYQPSDRGFEQEIADRMADRMNDKNRSPEPPTSKDAR
jgi:replication-associated recombination protein RarA